MHSYPLPSHPFPLVYIIPPPPPPIHPPFYDTTTPSLTPHPPHTHPQVSDPLALQAATEDILQRLTHAVKPVLIAGVKLRSAGGAEPSRSSYPYILIYRTPPLISLNTEPSHIHPPLTSTPLKHTPLTSCHNRGRGPFLAPSLVPLSSPPPLTSPPLYHIYSCPHTISGIVSTPLTPYCNRGCGPFRAPTCPSLLPPLSPPPSPSHPPPLLILLQQTPWTLSRA